MVRMDDGAFRLQVDVMPDEKEEILTRTYVFVAPGMAQVDVVTACAQAAAEAYRQDAERRQAESVYLGLSGSAPV